MINDRCAILEGYCRCKNRACASGQDFFEAFVRLFSESRNLFFDIEALVLRNRNREEEAERGGRGGALRDT